MNRERFFIEFSHENPSAAAYELNCIRISSDAFTIDRTEEEYAIIAGDPRPCMESAFVNSVARIVETSDEPDSFTGSTLPDGSFYLRVKDFNGCHNSSIEPEIGKKIQGQRGVTFKNPDFKVRLYHSDRWYLSVVVHEKDKKGMESRRAPLRPFFSPIAIHPKYARYLVNTTKTKSGSLILDPFCGTGGILLEAALTGRRIVGNDFSLNMVKGARLNLKYFNIKDFSISNRDIAEYEPNEVIDAIATDFPYGRNSNMKAESIAELYRISFLKFHQWLKKGSNIAIILSDPDLLDFSDGLFRIDRMVGVPQHRSLTRYFVTMERI